MSERYSIKWASNTANIPLWLIFSNKITYTGRLLAQAIIAHAQCGGGPPTREELAADFEVNTRTIDRWLDELRALEILATQRDNRRHIFGVLEPRKAPESIHVSRVDTWINVDKPINVDNPINVDPCVDSLFRLPNSINTARVDRSVDSEPVGVGVGHDSSEKKKPTTTNRAPLKTELARWLKWAGMNAARQFDDPALDYWTYRRFVEEKRGMGWEWRQIVSTLREAPLERDPRAAPALCDPIADEPNESAELAPTLQARTADEAQERFERLQRERGKR